MFSKDLSKFQEIEHSYWRYYCELEQEMLQTRKYVDFGKDNFKSYSLEYLKLYQAVCGEIDSFLKLLAKELDPSFNEKNTSIQKCWFEVQSWYQTASIKTVSFCKEYVLEPWSGYVVTRAYSKNKRLIYSGIAPEWWKAYTDIKHARALLGDDGSPNFFKANLKNVSNAFAALYVLEKNAMNEFGDRKSKAEVPLSLLFDKRFRSYVDENGFSLVVGEM